MIHVNSVSIYPKKTYNPYPPNTTFFLNASVCPSNATCQGIAWSSDRSDVVQVHPTSGMVRTGSETGKTAIITAWSTENYSVKDTIAITVTNNIPVSSISLNTTSVSIEQGYTYKLNATVSPSNATNKSLKWSSNNTCVATVNSSGRVYAHSTGIATITVKAQDGSNVSRTCRVTVTGHTLVNSVSVSPSTKTLSLSESYYLHATVCPCDAYTRTVVWSSSNTCVATVNPNSGLIRAVGIGTAIIKARAIDGSGKYGTCRVTVNSPIYVQNITLNKYRINMYKDGRESLTAYVCPDNVTTPGVYWSSNNPNIASVNKFTGMITAVSPGTARITATARDGSNVSASCKVFVKATAICPSEEEPKNTSNSNNTVADPVDVYTGAHVITNTLMTLFGGQNLSFEAKYDSGKLVAGDLGKGWYHNYEKHVVVRGNEAFVFNSPSEYSRYVSSNSSNTSFTCVSSNRNGYVLTVDNTQTNPYMLDCNKDHVEYFNREGRLAKIVDHQGFETVITYSGYTTSIKDKVTNKCLYLEKDSCCRIVRIYDNASRQVVLSYTDNSLTFIRDACGNTLRYTYDPIGRVLKGYDANNVCYFENTYDSVGRVIAQKDGITGSRRTTFEYLCCKRRTTDRNGKTSIREFDCYGSLVKYTDENGNSESYEYDSRFNLTKTKDANGKTVTKYYNSFNKPYLIIDKNGNRTTINYDSKGNITRITLPKINSVVPQISFVYNSRNQVTQQTDLRGTTTITAYGADNLPASQKIGSKNAETYSYQNGYLTSLTDPAGNTVHFTYNSYGLIATKTDADDHTTSYTYSANGNLLSTTDALGNTLSFTYDGNNQKTSETDANGNTTYYSYNGNMKNTAITYPNNTTVSYTYDGEDRVISVTDQANNVTTTSYDNAGRVVSKHYPDGAVESFILDAVGNVLKITNPKGAVTKRTYDALGNVLTEKDADNNITNYQYNAFSKVIRKTNAVSGLTQYEYSNAGDLLSVTDALGNTTTYTYDAFGNKLSETDAKGNTTTYTYDANNNLLTVTDALNHTTAYAYNAQNQLVSVTDANNHIIRYGYDAIGRRTTVTDARNNVFTSVFDANGNILRMLDAKGNVISESTYNSLNLPITVTDATGKTVTYTYTALGKVASMTDSSNHTTEYSYNSRGRNTSVRNAMGNLSSVTYDLLGNVTGISGPGGATTSYTYDAMGRMTSESTSSGGTVSYTYNALNIKNSVTNARGQLTNINYDQKGRIIGYISQEDSVSYIYDDNDNLVTVSGNSGVVTRSFDALNRVTSYTDVYGKTIRYSYDPVGNLSTITYPDNTTVSYTYDANNNLLTVTDWANRVTAYTYDVNNRVIGVVKPDGSTTTTEYDNKQRIVSTVERTSSNNVITGFSYTYDQLGRIAEEIVLAKSRKMCYTYDSLDRVTKCTVKNLNNVILSVENYTYDAAGNVTDAPDNCFGYDVNNRLTVFNGNNVSYDLDGNMLNNGVTSFVYDSKNRLVKAGGHSYSYDAENLRIREVNSCCDTKYTHNTNSKLSQLLYKSSNGFITKYVYGHGLIGEETESSSFRTYHFDLRGSTVALTNTVGVIIDTFTYDTYGRLVGRTGTNDVIFLFNGRDGVITDNNGLYYMRSRYYSPDMRRFVNADIVSGSISNSATLNRYAYANGNPVSNVDPFGLSAERQSQPLFFASLSPFGVPNTHVVYYDKYWLERWFDENGRAVMDRHWTTHSNPKYHSNPHDQYWNWSDEKHPKLGKPHDVQDPPDPPTKQYSEPWYNDNTQSSNNKNEEQSKKGDESKKDSSIFDKALGGLIVIGSSIVIGLLVADDITAVGQADNSYIDIFLQYIDQGVQIIAN